MRAKRVVAVLVAGLVAGAVSAGCSPAASRADGATALHSILNRVDTAASAVATTRLVLTQRSAGRLPAVTADAALGHAVESTTRAVHDIATIVIPGAPAVVQTARAQALSAAAAAVASVAHARIFLGGRDGSAAERQTLSALGDATRALRQASAAIKRAAKAETAS